MSTPYMNNDIEDRVLIVVLEADSEGDRSYDQYVLGPKDMPMAEAKDLVKSIVRHVKTALPNEYEWNDIATALYAADCVVPPSEIANETW